MPEFEAWLECPEHDCDYIQDGRCMAINAGKKIQLIPVAESGDKRDPMPILKATKINGMRCYMLVCGAKKKGSFVKI